MLQVIGIMRLQNPLHVCIQYLRNLVILKVMEDLLMYQCKDATLQPEALDAGSQVQKTAGLDPVSLFTSLNNFTDS